MALPGTASRRCKAVRAVGMECSPHRLQVRGASPQPIPGGQGAEGCGTGQDGTSAGGACGQVVTMNRSLLAHSPAAAHASQAESPLLHAADSHWKQDLLYVGNKLAQAAARWHSEGWFRRQIRPQAAPSSGTSLAAWTAVAGHAVLITSRHGARLSARRSHEAWIRAALSVSGPGAAAVVGVHALVRWRGAS